MSKTAILLAVLIAYCSAATVTWTGFGHDHQWTNPVNWDGDRVPGPNDDVVINQGTVQVTIDTAVNSLVMGTSVNGPANITFFQSFYVASNMEIDLNGNVFINSGTASVTGTVLVGGNLYFQSGMVSGQWTIAKSSVADLTGGAQKTFSACQFTVQGSLLFGGVLTLNQSSQVTVKSTAVCGGNVNIQNGDGTAVVFDTSAGSFTYNGAGTLMIQAPMNIGTFNFVGGNMTLFVNLQFANSFNIPAGSFIATVGSANVNMQAGVSGLGVLSAAGVTLTLGNVSLQGALNVIGGQVTFGQASTVNLLTVAGGYLQANALVSAQQLNLLGGNLIGSGSVTSVKGYIKTAGFNVGAPLSFTGAVATQSKSLLSFTSTGSLSLSSTGTLYIGGSFQLVGVPGQAFTNNGNVSVTNPFSSQNIDISGTGNFFVAASLQINSLNFQQNMVFLSGNGVFKGANSNILGINKVAANPKVAATFGSYTVTCLGECDNVSTITQPTSLFYFTVSS